MLGHRLHYSYARARFAWDRFRNHAKLRRKFRAKHGYDLSLDPPITHSDKIQHRKLFDHNPIYPRLTDKIEARAVVDELLGAGSADRYMVPLLAVADRFEDLDPALMQRGVIIKASHGSGWNQIVRPGSQADWDTARKRAKYWLARVYGLNHFEWAYRELTPRLLVEPLLPERSDRRTLDLKIYVYDGVIHYHMQEDNRCDPVKFSVHSETFDYVEMTWAGIDPYDFVVPDGMAEIQDVARALAAGFDTLRVDFLVTEDRWYLGELTLHDGSGMIKFGSYEEDKLMGAPWVVRGR